jgi:hypothetical protein
MCQLKNQLLHKMYALCSLLIKQIPNCATMDLPSEVNSYTDDQRLVSHFYAT